ncbi:hypothetical protein BDV28DRAFT_131459 [Aspergillus coremiiformis]|uniref:Amine oxidase domain-containing protein n=1 Tax=Aspergillus coremiiformis TaxID=138285 RepID=A0A5N6Z9W5_9EURO|nr:hypothetical protein BDV28DRAFT_131459 [Aspergillus coremiiformis]
MLRGLAAYSAQLIKYPYLNTGFNLPDPVPADLLLPFGEFVTKYNLQGAVDIIALFNQGVGDIRQQLTLYMMKYFSLDVLQAALGGFLQPASHNNSELYGRAQQELGEDAWVRSTVVATQRAEEREWVYVVAKTPTGRRLIRAKRLIVAVPPKLDILQGIDLDETERRLFKQFSSTCYYNALVRIPGIPEDTQVLNRANDTLYQLPPQPAVYVIKLTRSPNMSTILFGSKDHLTEEEVKRSMTRSVLQLRHAGIPVEAPRFVRYSDHSPFLLTVPAKAIRNGICLQRSIPTIRRIFGCSLKSYSGRNGRLESRYGFLY